MINIFDLDGTLIDSSHRQLTDDTGSLDLEHWRENSTPVKIMEDSLTPLGEDIAAYLQGMRQSRQESERLHIACTARVMSDADHNFMDYHGLHFDHVLSRPAWCILGDVDLKKMLLRSFAKERGIPYARLMRTAIFWDDKQEIREHFETIGTICYDPANYRRTA